MGNNSINIDLPTLFTAVSQRLNAERGVLNAADPYNGNHGDHMIEIFEAGAEAQNQLDAGDLPAGMRAAARKLLTLPENGSAQVYSRGLDSFGDAFEKAGVSLEELAAFVRQTLEKPSMPVQPAATEEEPGNSKSQVLKALVNGLSGWKQREKSAGEGVDAAAGRTGRANMSTLFDLGIAYMQARQRSSSQVEAIADAAVSSSPLSEVPYRAQSGRLAIQAFLEGMLRQ